MFGSSSSLNEPTGIGEVDNHAGIKVEFSSYIISFNLIVLSFLVSGEVSFMRKRNFILYIDIHRVVIYTWFARCC